MRFEAHRCVLCGRIGPIKMYREGALCIEAIECIDIMDNFYDGIPWVDFRKVNQTGSDSDC